MANENTGETIINPANTQQPIISNQNQGQQQEQRQQVNPDDLFNRGFGTGAEKGREEILTALSQIFNSPNKDDVTIDTIGKRILGNRWEGYKPIISGLMPQTSKDAGTDDKQLKLSKEAQEKLESAYKQNAELQQKISAQEKEYQSKFDGLITKNQLNAIASEIPNLSARQYVIDDYFKSRKFAVVERNGEYVVKPSKPDGMPLYTDDGREKDIRADFIDFVHSNPTAKECLRANASLAFSPGANSANGFNTAAGYTEEQIVEMSIKNPHDPAVKKIVDDYWKRLGVQFK